MNNRQSIHIVIGVLLAVFTSTCSISRQKARHIEKNFIKINATLYAGKYEVTNEAYGIFLEDLISQGTDITAFQYDSSNWIKQFPNAFTASMKDYYHYHPAYFDFPVVNISYEGAIAYCAWLTDLYLSDHKRTNDLVIFRLPSEEEWELLAGPGIQYKSENVETDYSQANLKYPNPDPEDDTEYLYDKDGAFFTTVVGNYPRNEMGLYDMIGNVAEMTLEKGVVKGGGWFTSPVDAKPSDKMEITKPDSQVGFRVVMEVLKK